MSKSLWQDARFGARALARHPGIAAVAVLCLSLGIGANTAIFSVVHRMLLSPLPYGEPEQLVAIHTSFPGAELPSTLVSEPEVDDLRARTQRLSQIFAYALIDANVQFDPLAPPRRVVTAVADTSALSTLGVEPTLGRDFSPDEAQAGNEYVVILSHALWQRDFGGDPAVLGRTIIIDTEPHEIVGVAPADFRPPFNRRADLFAPLARYPELRQPRSNHYLHVIGRMAPDVTVPELQTELDQLAATLAATHPVSYPVDHGFRIEATLLRTHLLGHVRPALLVLMVAVALVLLIACANVASLLLARGMAREKELAMRMALGAGRARIARQLVVESLVLAVVGACGGLLVALWSVDLLTAIAPDSVPRFTAIEVDWACLGFAFGVSVAAALLFGALPAAHAARVSLRIALDDGGPRTTTGRGHMRMRNALVAGEVAIALVLLIGAGLMTRSLQRMSAADLGFSTQQLVTMRMKLPYPSYRSAVDRMRLYDDLLRGTRRALPDDAEIGAISHVPLGGVVPNNTCQIEGQPNAAPPEADIRVVDSSYFDVMGIPVLRGRSFGAEERDATATSVIIDEQFARRYWPAGDAVGQRLRLSDGDVWLNIVGVVGHVKHEGLRSGPRPQVYLPLASKPPVLMTLAIRTELDPAVIAKTVQREMFELDPNVPIYDIKTMDERVSDSLAVQRFATVLLGFFAQLALLLAVVGIYAVMVFSVAQRTREIGIRAALGAPPRQVVRLIVRQGMTVAGVGIAIGVAGALLLSHGLSALLYGVSPMDPTTYLYAIVAVAVSALAACWLAARRAARVDPVVAMRAE